MSKWDNLRQWLVVIAQIALIALFIVGVIYLVNNLGHT